MGIEMIFDEINSDGFDILEYYYKRMCKSVKNFSTKTKKSLYLKMITSNSFNTNNLAIRKSLGFFPKHLNPIFLDFLINSDLIVKDNIDNKYSLTGRGILCYEIQIGKMDIAKLINYLERYFDYQKEDNKPLKDKEKVMLSVLLFLRAFSFNSCISIKNNFYITTISKLIEDIINFLHENECLKNKNLSINNIFNQSSHDYGPLDDEAVLYEAFHNLTSDIPKKTRQVFVSSGDKKYFLNLVDEDGKLKLREMKYIIIKIYNDSFPSFEKIGVLIDFMEKIAFEQTPLIIEDNEFIGEKYNEQIRDYLLYDMA